MLPYMLLASSKVDTLASVVISNKQQHTRLKAQQLSLPIFQRFKHLAAKLGLPSPQMGLLDPRRLQHHYRPLQRHKGKGLHITLAPSQPIAA